MVVTLPFQEEFSMKIKLVTLSALSAFIIGCSENSVNEIPDPQFNLPDSCVLLDDYEDVTGSAEQPILSEIYALQTGNTLQPPAGVWTVYHNDSSKAFAPNGERLMSYEEIEGGAQNNFGLSIGPWGQSGNGTHMKWKLIGGNYPHIGFGTTFIGNFGERWFDFSSLTEVSFWAKGHGEVRVCLTTDTILNGYSSNDNWGHFARDFSLDTAWRYYRFPVDEFEPKPWSMAEQDGLVWQDGMKKVCYFEIQSSQHYGEVENDSLEIYVDDIRLHGLTYEVFGLYRPEK